MFFCIWVSSHMIPFSVRKALTLFVAASALLSTSSAFAQTIESSVHAALTTHPSVESALAALNVTKEQENEAFSRYFPQISMNAAAGRIYGDNATSRGLSVSRGSGYSGLGEGSITVSQLIFDGLETPSRVNAAEARIGSANATIVDVRESLGYRAAQAYIDVLRARKGLAMISGHSSYVADYLGRIRNMVDEGASDETELQQARDVSVILEGIKSEYEGQVMAADARFVEVTGAPPPAAMAEPQDRSALLMNEADALSGIVKDHPAVVAARYESEAAGYDVGAEKATLYPDVNGELSYLKSDKEDIIGGEVEDGRALVRMSWNFSTGGEQFARIRRAKYSEKETQARMREMQRQIEQNVRLAYSEFKTSQKQLGLLGKRHELNAKLFSAYESQFEGARVNLLQLMQAHNQLFNTELETVNGQYRYLAAQYGVLASMGQLQSALNVQAPVGDKLVKGYEQK